MKWLRHPVDSLIDYTADRFYDRLRDRVLADLAPFAAKELDAARSTLADLLGRLP
ncbi:hypothetical protein [Mycobacteroides abscessus]|uniref:hypothetical protein n=1 Tax=Mycobacteroides abscessus TaxID=36809 RepID=UPI0009C6B6C2|nr:hypothetical protein [Mycobacteroides abscessus]MDM3950374.1 hypothetical protein [Mycobacteroides abscessus]SLI10536.1 Uncharacterised protein [Mycobacteroides abscessus subsp. massiliense]